MRAREALKHSAEVDASQERETRRSRSIQQTDGIPQVRPSQAHPDEDKIAEVKCMRRDARAAVQEREREIVTQEVLPRTTTTPVVLKASADHAVVESRRREDRTGFQRKDSW